MLPAEHHARIAGQCPEDLGLLGGAGHLLAVQLDGEGVHVDIQVAHHQMGRLVLRVQLVHATQHCLHPRQHLPGAEDNS